MYMKYIGFAAFGMALGMSGLAQASTVVLDFDSPVSAPLLLVEDEPGVIPGNCDGSNSGPDCLGVNKVGAAVLSIADPLKFSVTSFWFKLLGEGDNLIVTTSNGILDLLESVYGHNNGNTGGQVIDVSGDARFQNIAFMSFLTNAGNARVDDIAVDYAPVPVPAAGFLLIAGLGALAAARRKKA